MDRVQAIPAQLIEHLPDGVLLTDADFRVLDANPAACRLLGQTRDALRARVIEPLQLRSLRDAGFPTGALAPGEPWRGRLLLANQRVVRVSVAALDRDGGGGHLVTLVDLGQQSPPSPMPPPQRDPLTGLPGHAAFVRHLERSIRADESGPEQTLQLAVCRIDLDQFRRINAEHGAARADALLAQLARRLQRALRGGPQAIDALARLDGDEFALLLRVRDADEARLALARLLNVLRAPCPLGEPGTPVLELTASIGATVFPQDDSDAETLLRHAGHALYRIKHGGRNGFQFFDPAERLRDEASLIELARMQQALDQQELRLHYQPKIDMQSGRVLGVEALLRWQHPERGLLLPALFLPAVERTGLAVRIGDWVIEQALHQIDQWLEMGLRLQVSVNVTARQLQMADFTQRLQELIQRHQRPVARYLSLEVLESAALADVDATRELILRCRAFGVRFALDDFGTGYSTLTYLKQLPVDALKIDRSFIQHMLTDAQDMALVEGVIGLARHFGTEVIAEGVESQAHARALLRLGCQQGQGNGIAAAMPAPDVPAWVERWTEAFAHSPWTGRLEQPA